MTTAVIDPPLETPDRETRVSRSSRSLAGLLATIIGLVVLDGLVVIAVPRLIDAGETISVGLVIAAAVALNALYLSPKAMPMKFLAPGTVFLLMFLVYPVLYTVFLSFTNYGTGNIVSKAQATEQILDRAAVSDKESRQFGLTVLADASDDLAMLLEDEAGMFLFGTVAAGTTPVDTAEVTFDATGSPDSVSTPL